MWSGCWISLVRESRFRTYIPTLRHKNAYLLNLLTSEPIQLFNLLTLLSHDSHILGLSYYYYNILNLHYLWSMYLPVSEVRLLESHKKYICEQLYSTRYLHYKFMTGKSESPLIINFIKRLFYWQAWYQHLFPNIFLACFCINQTIKFY